MSFKPFGKNKILNSGTQLFGISLGSKLSQQVKDKVFPKQKTPGDPTLPVSPTFGDPAVRQAENDLKLAQRAGYGGNIYAGDSALAQSNRARIYGVLSARGRSTTTAPSSPTTPQPTIPSLGDLLSGRTGFQGLTQRPL